MFEKLREMLTGKKTYLLLLVYVLVVLVTGVEGPVGAGLENINSGDLQKALLGMVAMAGKAAFDRAFGAESE